MCSKKKQAQICAKGCKGGLKKENLDYKFDLTS